MQVLQEEKHDVSLPLRDLKSSGTGTSGPNIERPLRLIPNSGNALGHADSVLQTNVGPQLATTAGLNFAGVGEGDYGFSDTVAPPDTNGAVGATQYVQWVNLSYAVFDKATGALVFGPVAGNTLWSGFGGGCETNNDGDPIAQYDKAANRWVMTQFSVSTTPYLQCIAVSTSPDATGTYNRYAFSYGTTEFNDYPKLGVWPDAYYLSFNIYDNGSTFAGSKVCAYDRSAMLAGAAATQQCFQLSTSFGGLLPSDLDGSTAPPTGSPNFFMNFGTNSLNLWKFHVDFADPTNTALTGPTNIPVASFSPACSGGGTCIPQSGVSQRLDSLADRLMYRLAYRNFGDHESLVVNHSVTAGSSVGVRWYEIRSPNGTPTVYQQGSYAPDSNYRWMGSIAMDKVGNIAGGYSVSSSSIHPAIRYTGRAVTDTLGTLQAENTILNGTGSQRILARWGDYSGMTIDPGDDCTFFYTNEYLKANGRFNWSTQIASFKFPSCTTSPVADLTVAKTHVDNFTPGQVGASYTITVSNVGAGPSSATVYVTDTLPVSLTATGFSGTGWSCTTSPLACSRSDALSAGNSYPALTLTVNVASNAPASVTNNVQVAGGGELNTGNDTASDPTTIVIVYRFFFPLIQR